MYSFATEVEKCRASTRTAHVYCTEYMIYCGTAGSRGLIVMDVLKNVMPFSMAKAYRRFGELCSHDLLP
jgi:TRAP-type C4-dicarboxylate transport system permease small subunit